MYVVIFTNRDAPDHLAGVGGALGHHGGGGRGGGQVGGCEVAGAEVGAELGHAGVEAAGGVVPPVRQAAEHRGEVGGAARQQRGRGGGGGVEHVVQVAEARAAARHAPRGAAGRHVGLVGGEVAVHRLLRLLRINVVSNLD